jgi:asparagine synthetase B (glutamine-hydrolysing)
LNEGELIRELDRLANKAIDSCFEKEGFVLYSGGIDSSILAALIAKRARRGSWKLFTLGSAESYDIKISEDNMARDSVTDSLDRIVHKIDQEQIVRAAKLTQNLVCVSNLSHFEDCASFYAIFDAISNSFGNNQIVFSANGPDELFCGYDRFRRVVDKSSLEAAQGEIASALNNAKLLHEQVGQIASHFKLRFAEPFFNSEFADFCVKQIPIEMKIKDGNDLLRKRIWRGYGRFLGLPESVVTRRKKAMQYSMGFHKTIFTLIKNGELTINQTVSAMAR